MTILFPPFWFWGAREIPPICLFLKWTIIAKSNAEQVRSKISLCTVRQKEATFDSIGFHNSNIWRWRLNVFKISREDDFVPSRSRKEGIEGIEGNMALDEDTETASEESRFVESAFAESASAESASAAMPWAQNALVLTLREEESAWIWSSSSIPSLDPILSELDEDQKQREVEFVSSLLFFMMDWYFETYWREEFMVAWFISCWNGWWGLWVWESVLIEIGLLGEMRNAKFE